MKKSIRELQFKVLIEQDEDKIYVASVPELPGCYTQGKTLEQVRERIKEAIEMVLESNCHPERSEGYKFRINLPI